MIIHKLFIIYFVGKNVLSDIGKYRCMTMLYCFHIIITIFTVTTFSVFHSCRSSGGNREGRKAGRWEGRKEGGREGGWHESCFKRIPLIEVNMKKTK